MRSTHIDEWIQTTVNIESHNHDDTWVVEVTSTNFKKKQSDRYFNCWKQCYLKEIVVNAFLETIFFSLQIIWAEDPSLLEYTEGITKADIGLMNEDQQGICKLTIWQQEILRGPLKKPCQIWFNNFLSPWRKLLYKAIKGHNAFF